MNNEIIEDKWSTFINEKNVDKQLNVYVSRFKLIIYKNRLNLQDAINLIRMIPNVTTVTKEVEGIVTKEYISALYAIKFALEPQEDLNTFVTKVLKRSMKDIHGVKIIQYKGTDKLD